MRESADIRGDRNIIVQMTGDGNKVDLNQAHLVLIPWQRRRRKGEVQSEAELLTPYRRCTEFAGREREMADFLTWAQSDRPVAIRLVTGKAGAGKTRLAIELMNELASLPKSGWQTGFISSDEMARFALQQNLADWGWQSDTLAVLDYAAAASDQIAMWLKELANAREDCGGRLRLLLVEREADAQQGWWESLIALGRRQQYERLQDMFDPREPHVLMPLTEPRDRRAVLDSTMASAAERLKAKRPKLPELGQSQALDRQLGQPQWGRPLYLMMAGLCALDRSVVEVLSMNRMQLVEAVADREIQRLQDFGRDEPCRKLLVHMAAYCTLCRGLTQEQCMEAVKTESEILGVEWPGGSGAAVEVLMKALPGAGGGVGFIEPDIVGETVILRATAGLSANAQTGVALRAAKMAEDTVPACLIRLVQDCASTGSDLPMQWLETLIEAGAADDPGLLVAIAGAMPQETVQLRIQAVRVTELLLDRVSDQSGAGMTPEALEVKGILLNNLANRLGDVGRREDALKRVQEAVDIYGRLAESNPYAFLPNVAASLNNLAVSLGEVGQRDEALEKAQEAADICRRLAESNPDAYLPNLAALLNTLAVRLGEVGRHEEALQIGEEAADLCRQLAESNPDAFLPDLARALDNLANGLGEVGRRAEGMEKAQEAVGLYRQLAESNPDAFLPDLARALNNLVSRLSRVGRRDDALKTAQEAVGIRRQLAESNPDAFLPNLAMSLNNLSAALSEAGQIDEAVETAQEAIELYRDLAKSNSDAFLPDYAMSLNNLANALSGVRRCDEAIEKAREVVDLYRRLVESNPDAFLPNLAMTLNNLANRLSEVNRGEEACEKAQEAVDLCRGLVESNPDAFLPNLAMTLSNLANRLSEVNRGEEACEKAEEAVKIRKQLAESDPATFLSDLASSFAVRGVCRQALGDHQGATESFADALRALREPLSEFPTVFVRVAVALASEYMRAAEGSGVEPDMELLFPVRSAMQAQGEEGEEDE